MKNLIIPFVFSITSIVGQETNQNIILQTTLQKNSNKSANNNTYSTLQDSPQQNPKELDSKQENQEALVIEDLIIPEHYVINFVQTTIGHSYTGTSKGIKLWDGSSNIKITTENSDIPEDNITALALDKNNHLWIGTNSTGIVIGTGDPVKPYKTHPIKTQDQKIFSIVPDAKGYIWVIYQNGAAECFINEVSCAYFPNG